MAAINHVVVLMLENRSFDCMLGKLRPKSEAFDGLSGEETNPLTADPNGPKARVWNAPGTEPASMTIPDPDPNEHFTNMNVQIFGAGGNTAGPATMQGFALDYQQPVVPGMRADATLHHFTPDQVPVISTLANTFACSDRWHASAPCQTLPNRCFVHCGTAGGFINNEVDKLPFTMKTVFGQLDKARKSWKVYFHDLPTAALLETVWLSGFLNFRLFEEEFAKDAASGDLPSYSFIEPRYFADELLNVVPNDEHPPHNVHFGEQLIATVYNALRGGPKWPETLFIITYDEHGGNYDHVPPPPAAAPDPTPGQDGFNFDRYGVRVPAVVISPYLKRPGEIARPPAGSPHPFDHTSILATLRRLFGLEGPLTGRDAVAPDLLHLIDLDGPMMEAPLSITAPDTKPAPGEAAALRAAPHNDLQHCLTQHALSLPMVEAKAMARITSFLTNIGLS